MFFEYQMQQFKKTIMTWFMNLCAPFIPNDPTINFNRYLQASLLAIYTLAFSIMYAYFRYKIQNSIQLLFESEDISHQNPSFVKSHFENKANKEYSVEENSAQSLVHPMNIENDVSIKTPEINNEPSFQINKTIKFTGSTNIKKIPTKKGNKDRLKEMSYYFPILYGHFAIAVGISILYSPYTEQSIACIFYQLLTVPLLILNRKGYHSWANVLWIMMTLIVLFLLTCGLLQVGQANWDINNLTCFVTEYVSFYN